MTYRAPVADTRFVLSRIAGFADVAATDRFADATPETLAAVLDEAARLCESVLAPLNRVGDREPARLENGIVRTPPGFAAAHRALAEGGWIGISAAPGFGGMGLPMTVNMAMSEYVAAACLAMHVGHLLTQGQIEALESHASEALKALYLPRLIAGDWTGTMNLTEPQAGTDLAALRSRAEPAADGTFRVTGTKIFISWADNDFAANICHLVLARLPDAPAGVKGISLFMVPKLIPDAEGRPGPRNALKVVSLEHKLGLHGSPTAVMSFDGATGWLVGQPHRGLEAMFTMMNNARLGVAMQGVGIAEAATQKALAFAQDRRQGRTADGSPGILGHADVRRMLAEMRAETFSARAISLMCAVSGDLAHGAGSDRHAARAAFLTPIAKSFGSDTGIWAASQGIQVHGGMGFVEETGAAQFLRDARITAIYEGTNGVQAMDLVGRKLADGGEAAFRLIDEVQAGAVSARATLPDLAEPVWQAAEGLREATEAVLAQSPADRQAGAVAYQRGFARVLSGHVHLRAALSGEAARLRLARVAILRMLPESGALLAQVREGADDLFALTAGDLAA